MHGFQSYENLKTTLTGPSRSALDQILFLKHTEVRVLAVLNRYPISSTVDEVVIGFVNLCICNISKTFNVCLVLSHFTVYKQSEADLSHDKNNMIFFHLKNI